MPSNADFLAIERTALKAVRALSLDKKVGQRETRVDPWSIAEDAGIEIIMRPLDRLMGAYMNDEIPGILLNSQRPIGQIQMTCAHELGHHFLKHGTATDETVDYAGNAETKELEADAFAYNLLMPNWLLGRTIDERKLTKSDLNDPLEIYQLSLRLGVSYRALINKLAKRRIVSRETASRLRKVTPLTLKRHLTGGQLPLNQHSDVWLLTTPDESKILCPKAGDIFVIDTPSHAAAGFNWEIDLPDEFNYQLARCGVHDQQEHSIGGQNSFRHAVVGGASRGQNDAVHLRLVEKRPWLPDDELARFLSINLMYKQSALGLAQHSLKRALSRVGTDD